MHGIAEMLGRKEFGDPAVGGVIDEDGAQQRLLGLGIAWRLRRPLDIDFAQRGYSRGAARLHQSRLAPLVLTRPD